MSVVDIVALSLIEIVGDFSLKKYANGGNLLHLVGGIIGYIGVVISLIISLEGSTILLVNSAWDGISTILETAAAFILLGERFEFLSQYVGILLIIGGLFLLKIPLTKKNTILDKIQHLFK